MDRKIDNQMVIDRLKDVSGSIIDRLIIDVLRKDGPKDKDDNLECIVCNGKYVRRYRYKHFQTKKHVRRIKELKDFLDKRISEMDPNDDEEEEEEDNE